MKICSIIYVLLYFFIGPLWAKDLIVGTISNAPPYAFRNEVTGLSGFDIDIMDTLCERMHRHCNYKVYEFSQLLPALKKGDIDLAIASIDITPERQKQFLFSLPYKLTQLQFVTLEQAQYTTPLQLNTNPIGFYKSAPDLRYLEMKLKNKMNAHYYNHVADLFFALKAGRVDAIVVEEFRAKYWLANVHGFKMLGKPFVLNEGCGIAANLDQQDLINKINLELKTIEQDGTYLKIYDLYF